MNMVDQLSVNEESVLSKFPISGASALKADLTNPAIRLYGRRFYKDQTPIEYLAEFLLVFASPKTAAGELRYSFSLNTVDQLAVYYPENRIALKLFTFFPSSKLETRHPIHQDSYIEAVEMLKSGIVGTGEEKEETVRLLQSLFSGFVGVAKTRTWVTQSFLPASSSLLSREVTWNHPAATKKIKGKTNVDVFDWESSTVFFDSSTHNFFGRGGELLFLQLANLFSHENSDSARTILPGEEYRYFWETDLGAFQSRIEYGLRRIVNESVKSMEHLVDFVESVLEKFKLPENKGNETRLGWVPISTKAEALLFAGELDNICSSNLASLEKLELLQVLIVMQVMRSLCIQARRIDDSERETGGFVGNYCWIPSSPEDCSGNPTRKLAQSSLERIESLLYRALRSPLLGQNGSVASDRDLKNGDDNCFRHFRKFGKENGMIIPRKGPGARFVLPPDLLRFLVAALLAPGERVRLTEFYSRVFAHYGIALGERQLETALIWSGVDAGSKDYAVAADTAWVEEALQQGGFLVELSDAVSIVHNSGE